MTALNGPLESAERELAERVREALWQTQVQHIHSRDWFNYASDAYLLTDGEGIIVEANYAAALLLDARKEFLLGKPLGLFLTPEFRRLFYTRLAEFGRVEHWEARLCRPGGQPRDAALTATVVANDQGQGVKLRWMLHDVSQSRGLERSLEEARQQALQAEWLAVIGQMTASLAHESRNALQRSQACVTLLSLRLRDQPECLELLGRLEQAQDDLKRLFDDVRASAVAPRLQPVWCDLRYIWREAWSDLADQPEWPTAELSEELDISDLFCHLDPFKLKQVFRNLLENALSSGANPVRVVLQCRPRLVDGQDAICLRLRDNGLGIPAEARARLFEPFFTTKVCGTGLGLAICRRIVEAHGGHIHLEDSPESGTEMVLMLPRRTKP